MDQSLSSPNEERLLKLYESGASMERVACNLCGSIDSKQLMCIKGWNIVQCNQCSLAYLNPRPDEEELSGLYEEEYFSRHVSDRDDLYLVDGAQIQEHIAMQRSRVERIEEYTKGRRGKLLDVGCATGFFLACARARGWDVQGVEISEYAADYAREKLQLNVWVGKLEDLNLPNEGFDVVTMYHSLEHHPNPLRSLKAIRHSLKRGGWLVVELPNFGGFDARWLRSRWEGLRVPYHLYHFSAQTLTRILEEAGFKVLNIDFEASRIITHSLKGLFGVRDEQAVGESTSAREDNKTRLLLRRILKGMIKQVFKGRDMTAFAQKVERAQR